MSADSLSIAPPLTRRRRHITFRVVAVVIAVVFLGLFNSLVALLTPWVEFSDAIDHGWVRTPELHRVADSAAALLMTAVAAASVIAAVRPVLNAATTIWTAATLTMIFAMSVASSAVQGANVVTAVVTAVIFLAVLVLPFVLFSPHRRAMLSGGGGLDSGERPGRPARIGLGILGALGAALTIGIVGWRISGGVFESPREDDVIGLAMLGVSLAFGAWLCLRGRRGWRTLAMLLVAMAVYAVAAGVSLALG
ncbi:hypothetical protein [Salinibacterium sp. ZJ454]|uniref:hypothetical protein n=1 Tax=Salinibacterium sp. ZJ454 TaxID=2708339 RepID=UPI00141FD5CE|nr:hypothetical protein [Salinibacterium sp. ZJ454]